MDFSDEAEEMVDGDELAETVVYRPRSGGSRTIQAVVERRGHEGLPAAARSPVPLYVVTVRNDASSGISSAEVDTGGDGLDVAERLGRTAATRRINRIVQQSAGLLKLECR